jgi:hypothetical protein
MRDRTSKIDVKRPFQTTMMDMIVGEEAAILHPAVERPVARNGPIRTALQAAATADYFGI